MRVMVTGATGYVAAHSVKALLDAGHKVRLLVRNPDKAKTVLGALGIRGRLDCVRGDMTDEASVLEALAGCQAVLHSAGVVSTDRRRHDEMLYANPRGVELVVGHAARLGLDPIVYVSSVAALLDPERDELSADLPPGTLRSGYARSKAAAEAQARKWQDEGAPVVIVYPGSVTGPAAGPMLGEAAHGLAEHVKFGALVSADAAWSLIDARDLGRIHASVMAKGKGPRRYMCGGHYVRMEEMARHLQRITGRDFKILPLPGSVLRGLGRMSDAIARVLPLHSVFTEEAMICFTQQPPTDDRAVLEELGIRYRPIEQTLRAALRAARAAGLLGDEHIGKLASTRRQARKGEES